MSLELRMGIRMESLVRMMKSKHLKLDWVDIEELGMEEALGQTQGVEME